MANSIQDAYNKIQEAEHLGYSSVDEMEKDLKQKSEAEKLELKRKLFLSQSPEEAINYIKTGQLTLRFTRRFALLSICMKS